MSINLQLLISQLLEHLYVSEKGDQFDDWFDITNNRVQIQTQEFFNLLVILSIHLIFNILL